MRPLPTEPGQSGPEQSGLGQSAILHGLSAFTTLRTRHGQALMLAEHLTRLAATCAFLGLPAPESELPALPSPLPCAPLPWGLLRLTVTAEGTFWSHRPLPLPHLPASGAEVWLTDIQVHPQLGRHKTGNYLPYLLAAREATAHGAFEGLLLGQGATVADGSRCGLLLQADGRLIVPDGGLPSLTRAAWLAELGGQAETLAVSVELLRQADRVWLCGAGVGAVPVGRIAGEGWQQTYQPDWPQTSHPALVMPR